jgi:hypothetical protein
MIHGVDGLRKCMCRPPHRPILLPASPYQISGGNLGQQSG